MCGIALILSGVHILRPESDGTNPIPQQDEEKKTILSVADLKVALHRRGPDSLGSKKVFLKLRSTNGSEQDKTLSCLSTESTGSINFNNCHLSSSSLEFQLQTVGSPMISSDDEKNPENGISFEEKEKESIYSVFEVACTQGVASSGLKSDVEMHLIGATLQLRGISPVTQPLVDASGNILVYNGEIFGGIHVDINKNDAEALLHTLGSCYSCDCVGQANISKREMSIPCILSTIRGPWALIYWQARSKTLWFGRDAFGRRSLLVHWPTSDDPRFVLSSVSSSSSGRGNSGSISSNGFEPNGAFHSSDMAGAISYWDELPCGIYSICLEALKSNMEGIMQNLVGEVRKYEWSDPLVKKLIQWERTCVEPNHNLGYDGNPISAEKMLCSPKSENIPSDAAHLDTSMDRVSLSYSVEKLLLNTGNYQWAQKVLTAMRESVMRRTILSSTFQVAEKMSPDPVAVLFSGGLDSMILAALLDECLNTGYAIDLLNVSFDGMSAPDRISARAGLKELQKKSPSRRWQLVEIDAELSKLTSETKHLMSLITPANTYMDLNIGIALWLAARGEGFIDRETGNLQKGDCFRDKYKSKARILLVGSGADEQCAGYGRHRTKYRLGGWSALEEEMKLDMQRIWKRNLGRDDRCISDQGKEARFPFLDEDVIKTLLEVPLREIANLDEPVGKGDKKILREVAKLLGLDGAAILPKRAIQFGSRIARESNRQNFGSNRAANQASAGSVVIKSSV